MISQETLCNMALAVALKYAPANALDLWRAAGSGKAVWDNRHNISDIIPSASRKLKETLQNLDGAMQKAEKEAEYAESKGIKCLSIGDKSYPARLKGCCDAPLVLFALGKCDLNARRIVSVVGTRHCSEYGKDICATLTRELSAIAPGTLIISGLAYGIDINAHRGALAAGLPTVGVLAHGLDRIYPTLHRETARQMLETGGLVTEFTTGTNPDKQNFVRRNRIIAGLADVTVVVESAAKGGGLITASVADSYGREVCAFPGRISDEFSTGCNRLIMENKARMITSAEDLVKALGWEDKSNPAATVPVELELFPDLNAEEQKIVDALEGCDGKQINLLTVETDIPVSRLMSVLFELEMRGIVRSLNGARYRLNR